MGAVGQDGAAARGIEVVATGEVVSKTGIEQVVLALALCRGCEPKGLVSPREDAEAGALVPNKALHLTGPPRASG